jgi:hypothetical protein
MKRRWVEPAAAAALLAALGCVSFDPAGPAVPDITGTYAATIALTLSNEFEIRNDTVAASLALRNTGDRGRFTGTYAVAASDSGPFEGTMLADGTLMLTVFGPPPKPIADVPSIRQLYPWCDFARLGMPPVRGALAGDTLRVSVAASVPCLYQVEGGTLTVHTRLQVALAGVR